MLCRAEPQPRFDFTGHRAIVTGASRGIGRSVADMLGLAGAEADVFDWSEPGHGDNVQHRFVRVDISNAVLFLLLDAVRAITGEVLRVDAGQYI